MSTFRPALTACAGEPRYLLHVHGGLRVYPRVCGGARNPKMAKLKDRGLSPRVRGSLWVTYSHTLLEGSIPACAGEPIAAFSP